MVSEYDVDVDVYCDCCCLLFECVCCGWFGVVFVILFVFGCMFVYGELLMDQFGMFNGIGYVCFVDSMDGYVLFGCLIGDLLCNQQEVGLFVCIDGENLFVNVCVVVSNYLFGVQVSCFNEVGVCYVFDNGIMFMVGKWIDMFDMLQVFFLFGFFQKWVVMVDIYDCYGDVEGILFVEVKWVGEQIMLQFIVGENCILCNDVDNCDVEGVMQLVCGVYNWLGGFVVLFVGCYVGCGGVGVMLLFDVVCLNIVYVSVWFECGMMWLLFVFIVNGMLFDLVVVYDVVDCCNDC